ncbi:hypothetical protein PFICI_01903 [Pestalotiopsis fici W106-1]|uniref:RBR-type E3 ubiquitin transferase n=1 Tax=Pestalotiopsis fici (strain W106-1 / CGMCC3.15140) TaxID=1229662 RepID=W3XQ33_PESFW|nr:uncharacterized protein PFICI_01903 [Pestalotiopsis fici W106-1]ETS88075.1 hypothetical protein PFICI_01903 [Pestalotiopsis fici W106-1]
MTSFSTTLAHRPRAHRSHGAHHHHSLKGESPPYERAERREIELFDLDDLRDPIRIAVKETTCLSHVENFLKRRYADGDDDDEPVPSEARIIYYLMDERLLGDEIPRNVSRLYYRALESDDNDGREGAIRISWGRRLHLDSEQLTQIRTALEKGETIGELRCLLASLLDIEDPNRVVISAHGGLRPGLLQGNNWKATMIKSWLCHKIWIDIAPAYNYLIMKGVNEEYIYHPPGGRSSVDLQTLRHWLIHKLLTNVHYRASSRLSVDSDDFTLVCKGKLLDRRRRISFGQTVDFELARDLEDKFTVEEAWLLPQTTTCVVCSDDKRVSEMPSCITSSCEHEPNTCKECIGQWIASSMETVAWDRLRCPECSQLLRFEDVQAFAGKETFDRFVWRKYVALMRSRLIIEYRYDNLATKAAVSDIPDFKWCLNPRCQSGQIVRPGCQKVKCHSCKASSCANHDLPWHKGETCKEFDVRNRRQRRGEMASEKKVKEITKACPQCHKDVYKFTGCDHITCKYYLFFSYILNRSYLLTLQ